MISIGRHRSLPPDTWNEAVVKTMIDETGKALAASHNAIDRWLSRFAAIPGWRSAYDLLPGKRLQHFA